MLKDMLRIIKRDGYIARARIADELNISEGMVDDGMIQLLRMGYLIEEKTGTDCPTACSKCPYAKSCNKEIVKSFRISDKGGHEKQTDISDV